MNARDGVSLVAVRAKGDSHVVHAFVRSEHAAFEGHFPGHPVLPGMDVVRMVVDAASMSLGESLRLRRIDRARLILPIGPGSKLKIELRVESLSAPVGVVSVAVDARVTDDATGVVARLALTLVARGRRLSERAP